MSAVAINPATTRIGWIGTGVMGLPMCTHLLKAGYNITVFSSTISKAQPLVDLGATLASSPQSLAIQSDVVFTVLSNPAFVPYFSSAVFSSLRPGCIFVDMTTSLPSHAARIALDAELKNCFVIDAPVSGGDLGAKNGTLAIFAGGDRSVIESLSPVFALLGKVNYMGGPGKGQFAKQANQVTIASTMVGLVEGIMYAHRVGLDVAKYLDAISTGAAGSNLLELYGGRILKRDFAAGFYVNYFLKDLELCLSECHEMGLVLPGLALAQQLYLSLKAHEEGDLGIQGLLLALERLSNVNL